MLSIDGLVTGIDTTTIIEGLTNIEQRQIDLLESRRKDVVDRQTAFKGVEAGLLNLRSVASRLGRSTGNVFSAREVTSSDEGLITASAASDAALGVFTVTVNQLAQAHQIGSQGFASENSELTTGTFSLQIGNGAATDITVDSSNNTLSGLAEAINNADAGVNATIINDGSSAGTPYRLLLTAASTGESNAITVINNLGASAGSAVKPDFSGAAIQDATNASVTLGSGAGAINVQSSTNTIEDVISGVTMRLNSADVNKPVALTVGRDTAAAESAVDDFIESFNGVMEFIDEQSAYNSETQASGALLGNRATRTIQDDLRRAVTDTVPGASSAANRLSAIGVSVTDAGRLVLNRTRLEDVLQGRDPNISDRDLAKLFSFSGESTNGNVTFLGGSTRTKHGVPIEVDITQAATRGVATATSALAAVTTIDATNNTLSLEVDGGAATVTLAQGDYSRDQLAELVQEALNNSNELLGRSVSVGISADRLEIVSDTYGRASEVGAFGGTALTALGFTGSESGQGQDVVGQFLVDGEVETAIGRGRLLTGNADNPNTADLQVRVTLSDAQVQPGVDAELSLTRGVGARLDISIGSLLDPVSGRVKTTNEGFDKRIEDLQAAIEKQQAQFESRRDALLAEFVAMESAVSQLQSTSSFLASQLGGAAASAPSLG